MVCKLQEEIHASENGKKISILCPTRERPEQVIRLIESVLANATNPNLVEILLYFDLDDMSIIDIDQYRNTVKVFRGPRTWISNAQNFLYCHAEGEILMTAADDMVFRTKGWDDEILAAFNNISDRIALVFGNDLGTHAGRIATHGFFHRNWIEALGTWVQPGRGSLWDLWATENARKLGRLVYLDNLIIEHVHYRQSEIKAAFDNTYSFVRSMNASFRPENTYKKLKRERRIDRILLAEKMVTVPKLELNYLIANLICSTLLKGLTLEKKRRVLSVTNIGIISLSGSFILSLLKRK